MKKLVLISCLALSVVLQSNAQTRVPASNHRNGKSEQKNLSPEDRAKKDAERAEKNLALTGDQKSRWESAALERAKANAPLQEKMKGSTTPEQRKDLHEQMKANKSKFNTTVIALLTPEQKTKYEQIKQDRKSRMHKMREGKGQTTPVNDPK